MPEHALFDSPDSLLASFLLSPESTSNLILVTGPSGAGKTSWCKTLITQARARNIKPGGILSPAVFEGGEKVAIDLVDIADNHGMRLAIRSTDQQAGYSSKGSLNWQFNEQALNWGNQILLNQKKSDLLILDEIGPLELLENDGLTNGLKLIDERQYRLACVVIRPSLLATALERWPWGSVLDVAKNALAYPEKIS